VFWKSEGAAVGGVLSAVYHLDGVVRVYSIGAVYNNGINASILTIKDENLLYLYSTCLKSAALELTIN